MKSIHKASVESESNSQNQTSNSVDAANSVSTGAIVDANLDKFEKNKENVKVQKHVSVDQISLTQASNISEESSQNKECMMESLPPLEIPTQDIDIDKPQQKITVIKHVQSESLSVESEVDKSKKPEEDDLKNVKPILKKLSKNQNTDLKEIIITNNPAKEKPVIGKSLREENNRVISLIDYPTWKSQSLQKTYSGNSVSKSSSNLNTHYSSEELEPINGNVGKQISGSNSSNNMFSRIAPSVRVNQKNTNPKSIDVAKTDQNEEDFNFCVNINNKGYEETNNSIIFDKSTLLSLGGMQITEDFIKKIPPITLQTISKSLTITNNGCENHNKMSKNEIKFCNSSSLIYIRDKNERKSFENSENSSSYNKRKSKIQRMSKLLASFIEQHDSDSESM